MPYVGEEGADLLDHEVDGVHDVAEDVRGDLAALAQVALRDLGHRLEEDGDVLLEVLAAPLLLVTLCLGVDVRVEARHGVVEVPRELSSVVVGGYAEAG